MSQTTKLSEETKTRLQRKIEGWVLSDSVCSAIADELSSQRHQLLERVREAIEDERYAGPRPDSPDYEAFSRTKIGQYNAAIDDVLSILSTLQEEE